MKPFCTAHRTADYTARLPSQIALEEPRRKAPITLEQTKQVFTDWAAI